jgi:prepilin-type N-terminal cleavage/methylation domain-containing protein/prepilin-type processing-associated H-X9-DG protein
MTSRQKMLSVLRVQHAGMNGKGIMHSQLRLMANFAAKTVKRIYNGGVLYGNESGAFPYKSGRIGVYIGNRMNPRRAFTLIELLVVIAIIGILAALLLPVLAKAKGRAQGIACVNQGKQMMTAMTLYTGENNDFYPPNPDDGNTNAGYNWCGGQAGIHDPQEFDPDVLRDPNRSLLIGYLGGNVNIFRCPADLRMGTYQGSNPALQGQIVPAARTFSMSQAVGTIDPGYDATGPGAGASHYGIPNLSVNGPWLNNQYTHRRDSPWHTFGKTSDIRAPGPSGLWVLLDEDANGLNDAAFAFGMESPQWFDAPGTYHDGGCGFAFADGHSETHRWLSRAGKISGGAAITNPLDQKDWEWMQQRTSAK